MHGIGSVQRPCRTLAASFARDVGNEAIDQLGLGKDVSLESLEIRIGREEPEAAGYTNGDADNTFLGMDHKMVGQFSELLEITLAASSREPRSGTLDVLEDLQLAKGAVANCDRVCAVSQAQALRLVRCCCQSAVQDVRFETI